jgi:3-oxoacyl-[acyl-carrier protein] reductase
MISNQPPSQGVKMNMAMDARVIVVTGAASGIGRVIALAAADAGMFVLVTDIAEKEGNEGVSAIQDKGGKARFVRTDVSDLAQVKELFATVKRELGRVDVLVNNAGVPGRFAPIVDMSDETWHRTISVHLNGTFYCLREAARLMRADGGGRIINIASIAGLVGTVGSAEYGAAKAGIINLTKTAAKELGRYNITVNAIAPGMVATPINAKLQRKGSAFITTAVEGTPTGRMTDPEEIAALILFLCSAGARNINGQVICIDGGAATTIGMDSYMLAYLSEKTTG